MIGDRFDFIFLLMLRTLKILTLTQFMANHWHVFV